MKTILIFSLFIFAACRSVSTFDGSHLAGNYFHEHHKQIDPGPWGTCTERADLNLKSDSTFSLFIEFACSDFPGEAAGKWKCAGNTIALQDTTGSYYDLTFHANDDGTITGSYGDKDYIFNRAEK